MGEYGLFFSELWRWKAFINPNCVYTTKIAEFKLKSNEFGGHFKDMALCKYLSMLIISCLFECEMISHCGIVLINNDIEHLFMYLLGICISSLENVYSDLLIFNLIFYIIWVIWILCIFCIVPPYMICKYILLFGRLPFHFLGFLCSAEAV